MQRRVDALALPPGCAAAWAHTYDYAFATDGAVDVRADGAWHSIAVTAKPAAASLCASMPLPQPTSSTRGFRMPVAAMASAATVKSSRGEPAFIARIRSA